MDDYAAKATEKAIEALEKRINAVYSQAQKDIEAKTKDFWERHKAKDAMYQQQLKDGKISKADYDAWLRGQVFQGKQWEAKLQQVQATLTQANKDALEIANGGRIQVFATNANWQSYQIEKSAGVNFGFGIYDSHTVTRLLRDDPDLLPPRKLSTSKDKAWNKGNINRQISQGIVQGEGIDKIAQRLSNVTGTNRKAMLTNARTMMTNAQNAGRQESYQRATKMGIRMKKVWMATLDGHTRTNHRKLDGQSVDVDEPFKIGGYSIMYPGDRRAKPEMVYNCRCTMVSELVDYPTPLTDRYDNEDGKPVVDMTYEQWFKYKGGDTSILEAVKKAKPEPINVKPTVDSLISSAVQSGSLEKRQGDVILYYLNHGQFPPSGDKAWGGLPSSAYQKKKLKQMAEQYSNGTVGRNVVQESVPKKAVKEKPVPKTWDQYDVSSMSRAEANEWIKKRMLDAGYSPKQLDAMTSYMMESDMMNAFLRGDGWYDQSIIKTLASTMKPYSGTDSVYRGVDGRVLGIRSTDSVESLRKKLVGKTFTDKGFMSTSKSLDVAKDFSQRGAFDEYEAEIQAILVLDIDGVKTSYINSGLGEVLLNKGTKITYTDVRKEDGIVYIYGRAK